MYISFQITLLSYMLQWEDDVYVTECGIAGHDLFGSLVVGELCFILWGLRGSYAVWAVIPITPLFTNYSQSGELARIVSRIIQFCLNREHTFMLLSCANAESWL